MSDAPHTPTAAGALAVGTLGERAPQPAAGRSQGVYAPAQAERGATHGSVEVDHNDPLALQPTQAFGSDQGPAHNATAEGQRPASAAAAHSSQHSAGPVAGLLQPDDEWLDAELEKRGGKC